MTLSDDPVIAVNRKRNLAILEDGTESPIFSMLGSDGEPVDESREAVAGICALPNGLWCAIDFRAFEDAVVH